MIEGFIFLSLSFILNVIILRFHAIIFIDLKAKSHRGIIA